MNILLVILLVVFGIILLCAEVFLLPGFGIAGVAGLFILAGGVALAYIKLAPIYPWAGHVTLLASLVLAGLSVYGFIRSHALEKMSLDTTIDSKVDLAKPGKKIEKLEQEAKKMEDNH